MTLWWIHTMKRIVNAPFFTGSRRRQRPRQIFWAPPTALSPGNVRVLSWWDDAWRAANRLTDELLEEYGRKRPVYPKKDATRSVRGFTSPRPKIKASGNPYLGVISGLSVIQGQSSSSWKT
jgi:hypothetical protein